MSISERIPVVVLGGFLGSGKTTLLNNLIKQADDQKIVVLVNDFGALNVDAELVVGVAGNSISFANGCVCCTIHKDLALECLNIASRDDKPDLVIVELSGVSEPEPVFNTFLETELRPFFELSAVLAVVDTVGWATLSEDTLSLARAQVTQSDILVLSKTDIASHDQISATLAEIAQIHPHAQVLHAPKGNLPLAALFDRQEARAPRDETARAPHGLKSYQWTEADNPLSLPALENMLTNLPAGLVRMKGFLWLEELPNLKFLLQAVGQRYDITCLGDWTEETAQTSLVMIGLYEAIDEKILNRRLKDCIGTSDIDASPILRLLTRIAPDYLQRPGSSQLPPSH